MPSARMVFDVLVNDRASGSFRALGREAEAAGGKVTTLEQRLNKLGKAAFGLTAVFAAFAVNAAAKFESSMTRISTQAGVPIGQINALSKAILNLAPKVGEGPDALAVSLYHVESAFRTTGISAGKAIDIVTQAAKLSKIGNADLESTTQAIIGVLSSGIKGVKDATDAAAQLNQLVGAGDTTLSAVVKSVATGILPTAAALGLTFKDVSAALATLTDNATPADEAATRLRTTFSLIEKPSKQAYAALSSIGLTSTSLAEDFRKPNGLLVAMEDLKKHLEATYPPSQSAKLSISEIQAATTSYVTSLETQGVQQKEAIDLGKKYEQSLKDGGSAATLQAQTILQAFGGAKSGATFLTLYEELTRLQSKYKDFGTAAEAAAKFQEAWANQQKTFKQKLDDLKASWDVFLVRAGNAILPTLKKIVDFLSAHPKLLHDAAVGIGLFAAAWVAVKIGSLISNMGTLAARILGVGTAARTAATEVATANLGGAGAGAAGARAATGAFAAGGAARAGSSALFAGLEKSALTKIAIPVGLTLVAADLLKSLDTAARDIQKGHYTDGIAKVLSSKFTEGFTFGLSKGIADALKSGDWAKIVTGTPGYKALQSVLGHFGIGGGSPVSGKVAGSLADPILQQIHDTKKSLDAYQSLADKIAQKSRDLIASGQGNSPLKHNLEVQAYLITQAIFALQKRLADQQVDAYLKAIAKATRNTAAGAERNIPTKGDAFDRFTGVSIAHEESKSAVDAFVKSTTTNFNKAAGVIRDLAKGLGQNIPEKVAQGIISRKEKLLEGLTKGLTDPQKQALYVLETLATRGGENITGNLAHAIQTHTPLVVSSAEALKIGTNAQIAAILKEWNIRVTVDDQASWSLKQIRDYANKLIDLGLGTPATISLAAQGGSHGFGAGRSATGGPIAGPGSGTSDSIPRWLSNGEYVIRASSVKQYGVGFFDALNAGRMAAGGIVAKSGIVLNEDAATSKLLGLFQGAAAGASVGGGAQQWAPLVLQVLAMIGQSASWLPNVLRQINTESGGNPSAINLWDSNAQKGQPSQGLLQTIPSTFAAYAGPYASLGITNPLANIYAALNYAVSRYGSLGILGQGHGYANGTSSALRGWAKVGERGPEWVNFGGGEQVLKHGQAPMGAALHVEHQTINNNVDVREVAQQVGAAVRTSIATRRL